jgi:hypothetical protein
LLEGGQGEPPAGPPGLEPFVPNDESPSWSSSVMERVAVEAATEAAEAQAVLDEDAFFEP